MRIDLPGAQLRFYESFLAPALADEFFTTLLQEIDWQEKEVFVWGKWHKQPRLVAWYGDPDAYYSYSGATNAPAAWTPTLTRMRSLVEAASAATFNSVLLNLYRDQNDRMGWHSDNEPELQPKPTIASVSLGATRELLFKPRGSKSSRPHKIALTNGSLLVMSEDTQANWLHAVNRESMPVGKRINLTFRMIRHPS